jgi:AraC family transcriptional regulator
MADTAGLSPFHFARQFKISMGYSPYQFVLRQRIERAKQLLIQGGKSLAEIAVEVGFYDQSHFAQQFKRHCGITPKKFANKSGYKKQKE